MWNYRFLKRHGFSIRRVSHIGQTIPENMNNLIDNFIYTYLIICQIAEVLHEVIDNHVLEELFNQYGFSLKKYNVPFIK